MQETLQELAVPLPAGRPWKPFHAGPRELWLRCEGSAVARALCWLHFHWPWSRGQWRFTRWLAHRRWLARHLYGVRFRSGSGVRAELDIPSDHFLFLSGRLAPEPVEVSVAMRLVRPGDTFVDVGAHWGLYVLHVLGLLGDDGTYIAVEPSPESYRFLSAAFRDASTRLQLIEAAISEKDDRARLVTSHGVDDHLAVRGEQGSVDVKTVRLDTLLSGHRLRGRLIVKVDTEGHEAAVIRGCSGLARAGIRPIFIVEFLREMFGQTREDIIRALHETFGPVYEFAAIDSQTGMLPPFRNAAEVTGEVRNILAMPLP